MGMQIWLCCKKVKGPLTVIIWTNLVDLESLMLYTKIPPNTFLVLEKKNFKYFYHIWAWWPSCSVVRNHLNKLAIPSWKKAPCEIWWKLLMHFKKMTFQHFPHCLGMQIWPCCKKFKCQPLVIVWTNLVNLESSMLYTKIQPQSFLGSGEDFQELLPYTRNHLNKLATPFWQKTPCEIWWKSLKQFKRRRHLKFTQFYRCI